MLKKRGLSIIISTFLIILLVFVLAVSLVIYLNNASDKLGKTNINDCFNLDIQPVKCETYGFCDYYSGQRTYGAEVLVERGSGDGDLSGIRFLFSGTGFFGEETGFSDIKIAGIKPLETKTINPYPQRVIVPRSITPQTVKLISLVGSKLQECNIESKSVGCVNQISPPLKGLIPSPVDESQNFCCQYPWNVSSCVSTFDMEISCNNLAGCSWDNSAKICSGNSNCDAINVVQSGKQYCCEGIPGKLSGIYNLADFPHCVEPYGIGCNTLL